ncbi:MFS transporter [Latilactobacillus fuchuensis]|uniref:Xylose-proton symporter n=1 Tax=Latilactobacillus fuchuensis TaxID=164393 RepID=A0A2N9DWR6_9LACO|nr:glycoside-pentoside-hexuronide (GPH):cation symporter [Latilactobacillus fuchuensis]MCP8857378.1 glycoside-pentoside-hexuronide (GPH):cation symporter [Latilactobacillus fuchuensis]SPC39118.1 putative xylose-proton symporter [Latilactobacillus fuchuensis]
MSKEIVEQDGVFKTSFPEKIAYALGDVGCNLVWGLASTFLTLYYTDSVGLSPAFFGVMMLVARLLDAFSDILMGVVIEKTKTRWGKTRPWIIIGAIPLSISIVLLLNVPAGFSPIGKNAYAAITYIFMSVISYTIVNLSYHSTLPRISTDSQDRSVASSVRVLFTVFLAIITNVGTPMVLNAFGGSQSQEAWTLISIVYGIAAFILLAICFFGIKEKVALDYNEGGASEKHSLIDSFKSVASSKYFFLLIFLFINGSLSAGYGAVGPYYARDVLGNMSYFGTNTIIVVLPTLIAIVMMPKIFAKFGKRRTILVGYLLTFISTGIVLMDPHNVLLYYFGNVFRAFGVAPYTVANFTLAADLADFGEWKSGIRAEGFVYGCTSFGMKVGTGIGSAILGLGLSLGGYSAAAAAAGRPQSDSSIFSMIFMNLGLPMLVVAGQFIMIYFWDMDKIFGKVKKDLDAKRLREHAIAQEK